MPNNTWMDDLLQILKPEDPANVASMFSSMRGSVPIYAALYSKDASGPDELAFEARNNAASQARRDAQYAAMQKQQGLAAIPDEALRKAVAARMQQEVQYPPSLATRRANYAPEPRHEMRPFAAGGSVTDEHTQPDMADGGQLLADPDLYAGGGLVKGAFKHAKSLLDDALYHGGSYVKGETITQPLYLTPVKEMAESYVDPGRIPGSKLQELKPQVSNPAPERLVKAATRRHVPENESMGYTPASAFDSNLHEDASIQALIDELTKRGYDSAVAHDIGMRSNIPSGPALVAFPGKKAYAAGGAAQRPNGGEWGTWVDRFMKGEIGFDQLPRHLQITVIGADSGTSRN